MLNSIHVENFRKHRDLTIDFTPGINAIRAANEQGKSTLLEAISYAYFGAKGIKDGETIADVVSYDEPVNSLKVDHTFTVAGVQYRIVRSPRGAELTAPGGVIVTGQTEVTRFVEKLFGTTADMARKLMLAKQKNLGEALSGGPTEAGRMIEKLSELDLIDELVGLVAEHLPSGHTAATEGMIASLREQAAPQDLPDLAPLQVEVDDAVRLVEQAATSHHHISAQLDHLDVDAARQILSKEQVAKAAIADCEKNIAQLTAELEAPIVAGVEPEEIDRVRGKIEEQRGLAAAKRLHAELEAAAIETLWDQPFEALAAEVQVTRGRIAELNAKEQNLLESRRTKQITRQKIEGDFAVEKAKLEGRLIRETTCALCQKDLTDVPEVVATNSEIGKQLEALVLAHQTALGFINSELSTISQEMQAVSAKLGEARGYLKDLEAVEYTNNKAELLYARAEGSIELDRSVVPASWKWVGLTGEPVDYSTQLRELENARDAHTRATERRANARAALDAAHARLGGLKADLARLAVADAIKTIELEAKLKEQQKAALAALTAAEVRRDAVIQAHAVAAARRQQIEASMKKAEEGLKAAEAALAEMQANNALVKKLRDARPIITDQMWAIVLASVSTYLADVRGEPSTITRADGRFKINGRPVTGLSGSAEDVLGLAIRFALTKTFLPNIDFVQLDEAAAACDDERELAMLGLLATSGFAQTVLVTHSPLADAFAANIITL